MTYISIINLSHEFIITGISHLHTICSTAVFKLYSESESVLIVSVVFTSAALGPLYKGTLRSDTACEVASYRSRKIGIG